MSAAKPTRSIAWALTAVLIVAGALEWSRPDLLIVGNITVDIVDKATPTGGGAVSYAAVAARALGAKACVVTVSGPERLQQLGVFEGHHLKVVPANVTLTFAHTYTWWGSHRKLQVTANPNVTLRLADAPLWCRRARAYLLGPLTLHDIDAASFAQPTGLLARLLYPPGSAAVGLMAQGFQRALGPQGEVLPLEGPSQQLLDGLGPHVSLFLSDVETDTWPPGALHSVASRTARTLVTLGDKGADEWAPGAVGPRRVAPVRVSAVDTNGAGDTFGTAYMVALLRGDPDPGAAASWAASRAVLQPQSCKPHCAAALVRSGHDSGDSSSEQQHVEAPPPLGAGDRLRLSTAALLRRLGLVAPADALARRGWLRSFANCALGAAGARLQAA